MLHKKIFCTPKVNNFSETACHTFSQLWIKYAKIVKNTDLKHAEY